MAFQELEYVNVALLVPDAKDIKEEIRRRAKLFESQDIGSQDGKDHLGEDQIAVAGEKMGSILDAAKDICKNCQLPDHRHPSYTIGRSRNDPVMVIGCPGMSKKECPLRQSLGANLRMLRYDPDTLPKLSGKK